MAASSRPTPLRRTPMLALALLAGACSGPVDFGSVGESITAGVDSLLTPFTGGRNLVTSDALTVQRVRGRNPEVEPLTPEPGNVWPEGEAQRSGLMGGPEEAMRNIPEYRPSLVEGAPAARSPVPTPGVDPAPRRGRRGSAGLPAEPAGLTTPPRSPATPAAPLSPPPPRLEGQALTDPSGRPAIGTGGTPRVRGVTQPGIGGGAVLRDGNVETWIGPDGRTHTRIVTE